uniref:CCHC-type domain-containing protein n=1 Tax=Tanacetum cinerariifolium TaxID=118510 RepID=A0A6L2L589_TANCI|nr:hypothetical protein [Tanacetum cinerariifolium]
MFNIVSLISGLTRSKPPSILPVRIKIHLNDVGITAAHIDVNTALMELVLLVNFKDNILSGYYCWKLTINGNETIGFDKSNVECYNCHKKRHFTRECRAPRNQDTKHKESTKRSVPMETHASTTLVSCHGLGRYDLSDQAKKDQIMHSWHSHLQVLTQRAVPMKSGLVSVNNARQVNAAHPKTTVNAARPISYLLKASHSTVKRPKAVANVVQANKVTAVKALACWVLKPKTEVIDHVSKHNSGSVTLKKFDYINAQDGSKSMMAWGNPQIDLQDKGVIDSGCSRNMSRNMCYFIDYKEIDRGYVAFGGDPKGGKITRKGTKDETSGILKSFITRIENLVDYKVKVIRYDNRTEFKNREMNQAEEVNTACYMQNRVLVVKPYYKTPYELFHGRTPTLSFIRPLRYPVTILNTLYHLRKFNSKVDEGFFVRYSLNSKAFRVFNSRKRILEENFHIRFSESTHNILDSRPDCLFDIDALTSIINYEPIVAGTQSNGFAGAKASNNAGQARKETKPVKDYILLPLWTTNPSFSQDPKSSYNDGFKPLSDDGKKVYEDPIMPDLEDVGTFDFSNEEEDDDAVADMNNLDTTIQKIRFTKVKNASTPIETQKPLLKDEDGKEVDVHMYRYLKGHLKLGLWYPKDSLFDLVAYTDIDYAGASLERKSKTRGCQYLRSRLISWQCKKQIVVANSTTVLDLEKTKTTRALEITSLKRRARKLETKQRSRNHKLKRLYKVGLTARVDSSKDEQSLGKDASKQERKINDIDADEDITLVNDQDDTEMFNVNNLHGEEVFVEKEVADKVVEEVVKDTNTAKLIIDVIQVSVAGEVNVASIATTVSATATITSEEITLAQALVEIKTSKPKAKGIVLQEPSEFTTTTTKIIYSKQSQDKGKGIMVEEPVKLKKDQIGLNKEAALRLQAELQADFDDEQRLAREREKELKEQEANIALIETWDDVQEKIDAVKSPRIVDWKIYKEEKKSYYQIIKANEKSKMYMFFSQMLQSFDREDLEDLYKLDGQNSSRRRNHHVGIQCKRESYKGEEEAPYWNTHGKRESYKPRPSTNGVGAQITYYARKDFLDCHLPGEWEIAKDVEINPFKDVLVLRRMVEILGAIPINLKSNM